VVGGVFLSPWGAANTPWALAMFAIVNAATALIPALVLRPARGSGGQRLVRLVLYGVVVNNLASALLGTSTLVLLGRLPLAGAPILDNLLAWWVSDAVPCLVLGLPLLLSLAPELVLDEGALAVARGWRFETRKVLICLVLLIAAMVAVAVLERTDWIHAQWGIVGLVTPIALAAFQGGLGAAIWMNLPVCVAYLGLSVLPSLFEVGGSPRELIVPAYGVLIFFSAFGLVGGFLAGRNRQALNEARRDQRRLERDFERTVRSLAAAIEAKDANTVGHLQRVSNVALRLGEELGLSEVELERLRYAALLHDVGKIGVPEAVLNKPGPLDAAETALMQQHVEIGLRILGAIEVLRDVLPLVEFHQERWDGRREGVSFPGYFGLAGDAIPIGARILAVVDAFDAMTNDRPYRAARPVEVALAELEAEAGRQFDPRVVAAMVRLVRAEGPHARSRRPRSSDGTIPIVLPPAAGGEGPRPATGA
jgi:putative nucleotidyltransferase with HDIG domain